MAGNVRSLGNPLCEIGECPIWDEGERRLYWVDITGGKVWRYDPAGGKAEVFWSGDMRVGGLVLCKDGGLLLFTDRGVFKKGVSSDKIELLYDMGFEAEERFNDAIVDVRGRVFAGTMKESCREGRLFRFEKGAEPVCLLDGLKISNGMGFSCDGRYFYHTDSVPGVIKRYRFDIDSGEISDGQVWYDASGDDDCPDGMTVDNEDCVWVACWGGSRVLRLDADGRVMLEVAIPAVQVSSLTFGGAEYKTLYVTSAYKGAVDTESGKDSKGRFLGGLVYEIETDVVGRREYLAKL